MANRHTRKDEDYRRLQAMTAALSFAAALGVSGGTHAWMMWRKHPLIEKHRATLTFRSAIFGDGVIVPIINCLMMRQFSRWKPKLEGRSGIAVVGGSLISLIFHIVQGKGGMVNWTMTRPWRWNLLGYYHFVYMATQFSYMLLYVTEAAEHWSKEGFEDEHKRDVALLAANLVAFAVLLYTDYY